MKDKLEKFIFENRQDFDSEEPGKAVWRNIRGSAGIRRPAIPLWLRVASVLLLVVASLTFAWFIGGSQSRTAARLERVEESIPALKEAEIYYNGMIHQRLSEIEPHLAAYPGLMDELTMDFSRLDSIYSDLRNDLKDQVRTEEVVQALIQNYRIKLQLLEDLLERIAPPDYVEENAKHHEI